MNYDTDAYETSEAQGWSPAERVRDLNDVLRKTGFGGKTYLSRGVIAKGDAFTEKACTAVRAFDAFTENNAPWQEHDCATLEVDGVAVIFKIDYYDVDMNEMSSDPADPAATRRVLTIMLAEEY